MEHTKSYYQKNRVGETRIDSTGTKMKIIQYKDCNNVTVEYQDEYKYRFVTTYDRWKHCKYKNPYTKTIYGVACKGNTTTKINGEKKRSYRVWYAMLQRCYKESMNTKPTYKDCYVCEEWLCYEYFEKWYDQNYYQVDNEEMHLDKDILKKNNKCYCPEYCIFVPQSLNKILTHKKTTNKKLSTGVKKAYSKYEVYCSYDNKRYYVGSFDTLEEAIQAYNEKKEFFLKKKAESLKDKIPTKLYYALINYKVG